MAFVDCIFQSRRRLLRRLFSSGKFSVSSFALAVILTTFGVLITSGCATAITSIFSQEAATTLAHQVTNVMLEKTNLRVRGVLERATGIAAAAQSIMLSGSVLMPYEDAPDTWYRQWQVWGTLFEKSLSYQAHAISFFFGDGSYLTVSGTVAGTQNRTAEGYLMCARVLGINTPAPGIDEPQQWTLANVTLYDYQSMRFISNSALLVQIESRQRDSYNRSMPMFGSSWSQVVMSFDARTPTIKLSYSMFNASNVFLGIGEVQLRIDTFDQLVVAQRPTTNSNVILLSRYRNVVASSVANTEKFTNLTVGLDYNLTGMQLHGCTLASASNINYKQQFLICMKNYQTFAYAPLREMGEKGLIPGIGGTSVNQEVTRQDLQSEGYFFIAIVDYNDYFPGLDWIAIIMIPETEILHEIVRGRNIAVGVCLALAIVVSVCNGILLRLFLRPLSEIVFRMQSAAYLKEESNTSGSNNSPQTQATTSTDESHEVAGTPVEKEKRKKRRKLERATAAAEKMNSNRKPSYLSDVAAIQNAYWDMADELGILRGYIPEHIRDQLLEARRKSDTSLRGNSLSRKGRHSQSQSFASLREMTEMDVKHNIESTRAKAGRGGQSVFSLEGGSPSDNINEWVVSTSSGRSSSHRAPSQPNQNTPTSHSQQQSSGSRSSGRKTPTNQSANKIRDQRDGPLSPAGDDSFEPPVSKGAQVISNLKEISVVSQPPQLREKGSSSSNNEKPNTIKSSSTRTKNTMSTPVSGSTQQNGSSLRAEQSLTEPQSGKLTDDPFQVNHRRHKHYSSGKEIEATVGDDFFNKDDPLPIPAYDLPPLSAKASTRQAAKFSWLGNISEMNDARTFKSSEPLPLFTENGLVERNITVALINLTGFHNYVFSTPTSKVIKEHEYFVNYLHEVAKRCGGVLDNFNGDKFWVSFNASAPCDEIYVAATLFAYEVASTVNKEATLYQQYVSSEHQRPDSIPPLSPQRTRFHIALCGVTIGVATGRAFVGPLGTKKIRRLSVISNALSEASALERMAARYPDCGVMVGGDMIPEIDGYFQYMLLDATALPGSGGLRRRIASVKSCMLAPHRHHIPFLLNTALKLFNPLPSVNPFDAINDCFNAFLEGRIPEVVQQLGELSSYVSLSRQLHHTPHLAQLPDGKPVLTPLECNNISIMIQFMSSVGDDVDGRQYRSPLGDLFDRAVVVE